MSEIIDGEEFEERETKRTPEEEKAFWKERDRIEKALEKQIEYEKKRAEDWERKRQQKRRF